MPLTFEDCQRLFRDDNITGLGRDSDGIRYLKLRSLNRREGLEHLFAIAGVPLPEASASQLFRQAFESGITVAQVESCIREVYLQERAGRREQEPELINQLYRLQEFNWGGLHQNSLEKTIVDNYVKKIKNYDRLNEAIENNLYASMRGYVLCSWYNHWTSIIIEDLFKDHPNVLPAVGLVKKIDFFIRDTPFDLKVTYLPEGFLAQKRQEAELRPELTLLKQAARRFSIPIPTDLSSSALLQDLWVKLSDHPEAQGRAVVRELLELRNQLVARVKGEPTELIKWLYEEQGIRRFDASNRLFLVLVDQRNYFGSWKLKRAKALLEAQVGQYLDNVDESVGREIEFEWEGDTYTVKADLILVTNAGAPP
jgi:hypothetical protein